MFEWSSDIDYTEEEAQQEATQAKEEALENARILQKKQNLDKDIAILESQIQDLNNTIAEQEAILNNPTSTEEQKAQAELKKTQAELQKSLSETQLNTKKSQRDDVIDEIKNSQKLPEEENNQEP